MPLLMAGIGGALGSVSRYALGKLIAARYKGRFPLPTFMINLSGALLLGLVSALSSDTLWYVLLGDGFLGAFTTFSTFMYEGFSLFGSKEKLNAVVYISLSLVIGVVAFFLGRSLITGILARP